VVTKYDARPGIFQYNESATAGYLMHSQTNKVLDTTNQNPVQSVQATLQEGTWMFLQDATEATGLSEKTLRRYIKKQTVKSRRLGKQSNSPLQVWITADVLKEAAEDESFDAEPDVLDAESEEVETTGAIDEEKRQAKADETQALSDQFRGEIDRILKTLTEQFVEKLDQQREANFMLRNELQQKEVQLRLLPDLQKQFEEKEKLADFEANALRKQIDQLKLENDALRAEREAQAAEQKRSWWQRWFTSGPQ